MFRQVVTCTGEPTPGHNDSYYAKTGTRKEQCKLSRDRVKGRRVEALGAGNLCMLPERLWRKLL